MNSSSSSSSSSSDSSSSGIRHATTHTAQSQVPHTRAPVIRPVAPVRPAVSQVSSLQSAAPRLVSLLPALQPHHSPPASALPSAPAGVPPTPPPILHRPLANGPSPVVTQPTRQQPVSTNQIPMQPGAIRPLPTVRPHEALASHVPPPLSRDTTERQRVIPAAPAPLGHAAQSQHQQQQQRQVQQLTQQQVQQQQQQVQQLAQQQRQGQNQKQQPPPPSHTRSLTSLLPKALPPPVAEIQLQLASVGLLKSVVKFLSNLGDSPQWPIDITPEGLSSAYSTISLTGHVWLTIPHTAFEIFHVARNVVIIVDVWEFLAALNCCRTSTAHMSLTYMRYKEGSTDELESETSDKVHLRFRENGVTQNHNLSLMSVDIEKYPQADLGRFACRVTLKAALLARVFRSLTQRDISNLQLKVSRRSLRLVGMDTNRNVMCDACIDGVSETEYIQRTRPAPGSARRGKKRKSVRPSVEPRVDDLESVITTTDLMASDNDAADATGAPRLRATDEELEELAARGEAMENVAWVNMTGDAVEQLSSSFSPSYMRRVICGEFGEDVQLLMNQSNPVVVCYTMSNEGTGGIVGSKNAAGKWELHVALAANDPEPEEGKEVAQGSESGGFTVSEWERAGDSQPSSSESGSSASGAANGAEEGVEEAPDANANEDAEFAAAVGIMSAEAVAEMAGDKWPADRELEDGELAALVQLEEGRSEGVWSL